MGSEKQAVPWLGSIKSSIDDWDIALNDALDKEESLADVFSKHSDVRVSIFIEGGPSKGFTKESCERDIQNYFFQERQVFFNRFAWTGAEGQDISNITIWSFFWIVCIFQNKQILINIS